MRGQYYLRHWDFPALLAFCEHWQPLTTLMCPWRAILKNQYLFMNIITVPAALHSECINIINVNCMPHDQKQFQYLECITSLQWKICSTELDSYKEDTFSAKRQLPKFQTPCCQLSKNVRREMPEIPGSQRFLSAVKDSSSYTSSSGGQTCQLPLLHGCCVSHSSQLHSEPLKATSFKLNGK